MFGSLFFGFWFAEKIDRMFDVPALGFFLWAVVLSCFIASVVLCRDGVSYTIPILAAGYVVWFIGAWLGCVVQRIIREVCGRDIPPKVIREG